MHDEGKGPFYLDLTGGTEEEIRYIEWSIGNEGKGSLFLDYLKNQEGFDFRKDKLEWLPNSREMAGTAASGFWVDTNMETEVPNLFAAGDDVGGVPWMCSPGAFTMGWRAGEMAALAAKKQERFPCGRRREDGIPEKILLRCDPRQRRAVLARGRNGDTEHHGLLCLRRKVGAYAEPRVGAPE